MLSTYLVWFSFSIITDMRSIFNWVIKRLWNPSTRNVFEVCWHLSILNVLLTTQTCCTLTYNVLVLCFIYMYAFQNVYDHKQITFMEVLLSWLNTWSWLWHCCSKLLALKRLDCFLLPIYLSWQVFGIFFLVALPDSQICYFKVVGGKPLFGHSSEKSFEFC